MMKNIVLLATTLISLDASAGDCSPLLDFNVRSLNEKTEVNLCEAYQGKVIMIVNTASAGIAAVMAYLNRVRTTPGISVS